MKLFTLSLFLILAWATGGWPQGSGSGFEVGEPFPNVTLPSAEDGSPLSLADFRGQKVILHIFASW